MPSSVDIKDELVSQGVGTFAASSGWGIFISEEPDDSNTPDTTITIFDLGGANPNPKWKLDNIDIQIRVRGDEFGYQTAYSKCEEIKNDLLGLSPKTINSTNYIGFYMRGDINSIGYDDKNRPIFTMNFRLITEPTSSSNRTALT